MSAAAPEPARGAYAAAAIGLAGLALAAIWLPAFPAGTDLPTHMAFARMVWAPEQFEGWIDVAYPPTAQLFVWLVAPLTGLGPALAAKIGLTFVAVAIAGGAWAVGRALGDRRPAGLLVGLLATQTFSTAMGFSNFTLATGFGLGAIALWIRACRAPSPWAWAAVGAWMCVVAHTHVMLAGMVGAQLVLLAATWGSRFDVHRILATTVSLVPAGVFSLAVAIAARQGYETEVAVGLSTQRLAWTEVLGNVAATSFGGLSAFGSAAVAAVVIGMAVRATGGVGHGVDRRTAVGASLAAATAFWAAAYVVVPFHGWGWAYAQPRVLVPLFVFGGAMAGWGRRPPFVLAVLVTAGVLHLGSATAEAVRVGDAIGAQVAAYGDSAPGRSMEVVLDPGATRHRTIQPMLHVPWYALARGGVSPLMPHYSPMIHSVRATWDPPPHPPLFVYRALECDPGPACDAEAARLRRRVAVQGLRFDTVLFVGGDTSWWETMSAAGYERAAPAAWRPVPGGIEVEVAVPAGAEGRSIEVRAGYPEDLGWVVGASRPPGMVPTEPLTLELGPLPAGPVVVEVGLGATADQPPELLGRARVVVDAGRVTPVRLAPAAP